MARTTPGAAGPVERLAQTLDGLPPGRATLLARLAVPTILAVGLFDYGTGYQFGCSIFYVVPILVAAWAAGRRAGLALSALAAATWVAAELADGRHYHSAFLPLWNAAARFGVFAVVALLLDGLKRNRSAARRDALTGLANRPVLVEALSLEMERCRRHGRPLTLAYMDCDDFKRINDRHGHLAGDAVLRTLADVLRANVRRSDTPARLAGDEFALLLPETGPEQARGALRKVQGLLRERAGRWQATVSIGSVTYLSCPRELDEVLSRADGLMYEAKAAGKDSLRHEVVGEAGEP